MSVIKIPKCDGRQRPRTPYYIFIIFMAEGEAAMNAASRILNSLAVKSFFSRFYDNQPTACKLKNRNTQCIPA